MPLNSSSVEIKVTYLNGSLLSIPIEISFINLEEEPINRYWFSRSIEDNGQIESIQLVNSTTLEILDEVKAQPNPLEFSVDFPISFEREKLTEISWDFGGSNATTMTTKVMYSSDGKTWIPITQPTVGSAQNISIYRLPGGSVARLGVFTTDGVKTMAYLSQSYKVSSRAPDLRFKDVFKYIPNPDPTPENPFNRTLIDPFVNATAGSKIGLNVHATDEYGNEIPFGNYEWVVTDSAQQVLFTKSSVGDNFLLKFENPGDYFVTTTVVDPNSGQKTSDILKVVVYGLDNPYKETDYHKFLEALEAARTKTDPTQSSTTQPNETSTGTETKIQTTDQPSVEVTPPPNPLSFQFVPMVIVLVVLLPFRRRLNKKVR